MSERPDVLWIYCDELRADALGVYAAADGWQPRTPRIDALAATGAVFDRCYADSPVCVPSRTAALTGRSPDETGVYHNEAYAEGFPLPAGLTTFPEVFAAAGCATASFGKEHVPKQLRPWQLDDGTGAGMRDPVRGAQGTLLRSAGMGFVVGGSLPEGEPFAPEQVTTRARGWLRERARDGSPFLLRVSYLQPHTPVVAPERFLRRVQDLPTPDLAGRPTAGSEFERAFSRLNAGRAMTAEQLRRAQLTYHALVAWVDEQVGILLDDLTALGMRENTIVVLTSDHGAHLGDGGAFGKQTFAPQSHRVPLLVSWPGRVEPGRRDDLTRSSDLARTLTGLAGIEPPAAFGGRDLFTDPAPAEIHSVIGFGAPTSRAFPNRGEGTWPDGRGWPRRSCVRTARHRLDATTRIEGRTPAVEDEDVFLADTTADPREVVNLADDPRYADVRAELLASVRDRARGAVQVSDELLADLAGPRTVGAP